MNSVAEHLGSLLSRAPRHRRRRQTRAGSSHRNRRPAVSPHERRVSPCLARAHSPAPKNFRPVESSTISVGHLFVLVSTTTSTVRRRDPAPADRTPSSPQGNAPEAEPDTLILRSMLQSRLPPVPAPWGRKQVRARPSRRPGWRWRPPRSASAKVYLRCPNAISGPKGKTSSLRVEISP